MSQIPILYEDNHLLVVVKPPISFPRVTRRVMMTCTAC